MKTYFFDLDGTIFYAHKAEWLPGAREMLQEIYKQGNRIIFITMTGPQHDGLIWDIAHRKASLDSLGISYTLIDNCFSPRILVDDCAYDEVIHRDTNQEWK